jgi:hypothetical protein
MSDPRQRILHNPFYVLGLPVTASRAEVEREGQKHLGMLALGLSAAGTYDTPLGPAQRTPEAVREAMAELRDPERRLIHELWARVPAADGRAGASGPRGLDAGADAGGAPAAGAAAGTIASWPDALAILGWQPRARRRHG